MNRERFEDWLVTCWKAWSDADTDKGWWEAYERLRGVMDGFYFCGADDVSDEVHLLSLIAMSRSASCFVAELDARHAESEARRSDSLAEVDSAEAFDFEPLTELDEEQESEWQDEQRLIFEDDLRAQCDDEQLRLAGTPINRLYPSIYDDTRDDLPPLQESIPSGPVHDVEVCELGRGFCVWFRIASDWFDITTSDRRYRFWPTRYEAVQWVRSQGWLAPIGDGVPF